MAPQHLLHRCTLGVHSCCLSWPRSEGSSAVGRAATGWNGASAGWLHCHCATGGAASATPAGPSAAVMPTCWFLCRRLCLLRLHLGTLILHPLWVHTGRCSGFSCGSWAAAFGHLPPATAVLAPSARWPVQTSLSSGCCCGDTAAAGATAGCAPPQLLPYAPPEGCSRAATAAQPAAGRVAPPLMPSATPESCTSAASVKPGPCGLPSAAPRHPASGMPSPPAPPSPAAANPEGCPLLRGAAAPGGHR